MAKVGLDKKTLAFFQGQSAHLLYEESKAQLANSISKKSLVSQLINASSHIVSNKIS